MGNETADTVCKIRTSGDSPDAVRRVNQIRVHHSPFTRFLISEHHNLVGVGAEPVVAYAPDIRGLGEVFAVAKC